ncbi:MAG TPA: hypothetical protein VE197_00110 [Mycobacterium sp.]|nr:hypothetical protein [Mycobacterium sp.]
MADATNVTHTPTVRTNGQDYQLSTPDSLVARINEHPTYYRFRRPFGWVEGLGGRPAVFGGGCRAVDQP